MLNKEMKLLIEYCDEAKASVIHFNKKYDVRSDDYNYTAVIYYENDDTMFAHTAVFDKEENKWK